MHGVVLCKKSDCHRLKSNLRGCGRLVAAAMNLPMVTAARKMSDEFTVSLYTMYALRRAQHSAELMRTFSHHTGSSPAAALLFIVNGAQRPPASTVADSTAVDASAKKGRRRSGGKCDLDCSQMRL